MPIRAVGSGPKCGPARGPLPASLPASLHAGQGPSTIHCLHGEKEVDARGPRIERQRLPLLGVEGSAFSAGPWWPLPRSPRRARTGAARRRRQWAARVRLRPPRPLDARGTAPTSVCRAGGTGGGSGGGLAANPCAVHAPADFCRVRGYISTVKNHGMPALDCLRQALERRPFLPPVAAAAPSLFSDPATLGRPSIATVPR